VVNNSTCSPLNALKNVIKKEDVSHKCVKEITNILQELGDEFNGKTGVIQEMISSTYSISTGGVTMLNMSRWSGATGSYRSIQRMMSTHWDWLKINLICFGMWTCMTLHPQRSEEELAILKKRYILTLDEVVEPKSRSKTYGIGRFFSSIIQKPVNAIKTHVASIVDREKRKSFVLDHCQILKSKESVKSQKHTGVKAKAKLGRPKGSKNKKKAGRPKGSKNKMWQKEEGLIYSSMASLLSKVCPSFLKKFGFGLSYVVGDGSYGNKTACLIAREWGLDLISKLNCTSALYWPFQGVYNRSGRPPIYGERIDLDKIAVNYRVSYQRQKDGTIEEIYHLNGVRSKRIPYVLNVVVIIRTKPNGQTARVILMSTCLNLTAEDIIEIYRLRFQIEFNFRNAKQYFGLADFKNTKPKQVNNAIGWSFFMENISTILLEGFREEHQNADLNIQDLKAWFRGHKYLDQILNYAEKTDEPILNQQQKQRILKMGAINWNKGSKKNVA